MPSAGKYEKLCQLISSSPGRGEDISNSDFTLHIWNKGVTTDAHGQQADIPANGFYAIALRLDAPARLERLFNFVKLPFHLKSMASRMRRHGIEPLGHFGVYPNLDDPFLVFSLRSPASRYTEKNILPDIPGGALGVMYKILSLWSGCYPTIEGVLILGRKT